MQSNPIQQRIELICEKWEEAKKHRDARIVRIQCQPDEEDMVDTFYTYMIGADTPILDIAFHFDAACTDTKLFSTQLVKELEEILHIWNDSHKDARIEYVPLQWKPDYSLLKDKNPAALFVQNFNRLAKEMDLEKGLFAVAVFRSSGKEKKLQSWLADAAGAAISPAVKFLVHDTVTHPVFNSLSLDIPSGMATIALNLDMPKAMEQTAAMGDPKDPATAYRQSFMKMINAMGAQKETEAEKWGEECITLATQNLGRDPHWVTQMVVVYIALANDKIRYKKKKEIICYADKAVETATAAQMHFENEAASVLLAQALMFRGTVLFVQGNGKDAYTDLSIAYEIYRRQGNVHLAIEACRMAGKSAFKDSQPAKGFTMLARGVQLGKSIDPVTARSSTFPGLLELLLKNNYASVISMVEIDGIARNLYGKDWPQVVNNWKQAPGEEVLQAELEAVGS